MILAFNKLYCYLPSQGFLTAVTMSVDFRNIVTQGNEFGLRMVNTLCLLLQKVGRDTGTVLRRITGNFRILGVRGSQQNRTANSYESNYYNNSRHDISDENYTERAWNSNSNSSVNRNTSGSGNGSDAFLRYRHPGALTSSINSNNNNGSGSSSASSSSSDMRAHGVGQEQDQGERQRQGEGQGERGGQTDTRMSTAHSLSLRLSSLCTSTSTAVSTGLHFIVRAILSALRHADERLRRTLIFVLRIILRRP